MAYQALRIWGKSEAELDPLSTRHYYDYYHNYQDRLPIKPTTVHNTEHTTLTTRFHHQLSSRLDSGGSRLALISPHQLYLPTVSGNKRPWNWARSSLLQIWSGKGPRRENTSSHMRLRQPSWLYYGAFFSVAFSLGACLFLRLSLCSRLLLLRFARLSFFFFFSRCIACFFSTVVLPGLDGVNGGRGGCLWGIWEISHATGGAKDHSGKFTVTLCCCPGVFFSSSFLVVWVMALCCDWLDLAFFFVLVITGMLMGRDRIGRMDWLGR